MTEYRSNQPGAYPPVGAYTPQPAEAAGGPGSPYAPAQTQIDTTSLIAKVYGWMFMALAVSGGVAAWAYETNFTERLGGWLFAVLIGTFVLALVIGWGINRISAGTATALFVIYAIAMGLFLSTVFYAYDLGTISAAFFASAGAYGLMAVIGFATKKDLSGFGMYLLMALFGVIVLGILTIFIPSLITAYTWIGLLVFLGLAVYENNVIKNSAKQAAGTGAAYERKFAIFWALQTYLTFINIFLFMLRIVGGGGSR